MESEQKLLLMIKEEFDNSAGTLTLSIKQFKEFFQLNDTTTAKIIEKLVNTGHYELIKDFDDITGKEIERLHVYPIYARNYWLKAELVEKEAKILLEIGKLLERPFNSGITDIFTKDRHLIKLDLRDQKLANLPEMIDTFTHLRELRLQNNKLTQLPETIGRLKHLKILDLDRNAITFLPNSIGKLKALEELWIRENKLEDLPNSLKNLKNLKILSLTRNRLTPDQRLLKIVSNVQRVEWDKEKSDSPLIIFVVGTASDLDIALIESADGRVFNRNQCFISPGPYVKSLDINVDHFKRRIFLWGNYPTPISHLDLFPRSYQRVFQQGTLGGIIVFDKGNLNSFTKIPQVYEYFKKEIKNVVSIAIIGIKTDTKKITREKGEKLAKDLQCDYFETTLTDHKEVKEIIHLLTEKTFEKY